MIRTREVMAAFRKIGQPDSPVPVLLIGAGALFWIQLQRPITDVDIFFQVKLGEIILHNGLPSTEPLLAGKESQAFVPVAWLGQVVYAVVRMVGGWPLLWLTDALVWFGGLFVVARFCARRIGNDWPALFGLFIGWLAAIPHASLRPQSWGFLAFGLLVCLCRCRWKLRNQLLVGALLLIVWQNLHPSVVVGVAYLGCLAFVDWIRFGLRIETEKPWLPTLLLPVAVSAYFLTPAGTSMLMISAYNAEISRERNITEWLPMWKYPLEYGRDNAWAAIGLFIAVLMFVVAVRIKTCVWRVRAADVAVVIGLTVASLFVHRFIPFWSIAVIPVIAEAFAFSMGPVTRPKRIRVLVGIAAIVGVLLPPIMRWQAPFHDYYAFDATHHLKESGFRGVVFSNYFWGGMLADAGYPDWKVTHDGRYYLFTRDEWRLYNAVTTGRMPLDDILQHYHPDAFVLRKPWDDDYPFDDGLIRLLHNRWRVAFQDGQSIVYLRDP